MPWRLVQICLESVLMESEIDWDFSREKSFEKNNLIRLFCFENNLPELKSFGEENKYELELNRLHLSKLRECFSASKIGSFNNPYDFKILCQTPSCFTTGEKTSPGDPTHPSTWQATTPSSKGHMAWHDMTWQFNTMQDIYIYMRILHILWPWLFPDLSNVTTKQILEKKTPSPPSPPPCYRPDTWQPPLFELLAVASVRHKPSKWRGHTALFEWVQVRLGEKSKPSKKKKSLAQKKTTPRGHVFFLILKRW